MVLEFRFTTRNGLLVFSYREFHISFSYCPSQQPAIQWETAPISHGSGEFACSGNITNSLNAATLRYPAELY